MLGKNLFTRLKPLPSPGEAQTHFDAGLYLATEGFYAQALVELKLAIRANPDSAEARLELGLTYHKMGQLDRAIKAYLSVIEIYPSLVTAYKNLGIAYDDLGHFLKALKVYMKAIALAPQDPEVHAQLAEGLRAKGLNAEAEEEMRRAQQAHPQ